ncbi:Aldehyde dehydrogenase [compost metagenome]
MIEQVFLHQKNYSLVLRTEPCKVRIELLTTLEKMVDDNQEDIAKALYEDFKKPSAEALSTEIYPLLSEIRYLKKRLKKWMSPFYRGTPPSLMGSKSWIQYQARGACLVISPWNYPLLLALGPAVAALSAGNCVMLKPSEHSPATSRLIAKLVKENFPEEIFTVITGAVETTTELLKLPFDHIFFTGSTEVGKIVMKAASENLTSVTLELGGKSPTIVDSTAKIDEAVQQILWGKIINAGQTCVAPDYLFVQDSIYTHFIEKMKQCLADIYGATPEAQQKNPDIARIISSHHFDRLREMLEESLSNNATLITGGQHDYEDLYIAPTLIEKVSLEDRLMQEEIFGPILPVMKFHEISEVIKFINSRPNPLSLYIFSHSKWNIKKILKETSSGGVCINELLLQVANHHLPFGGVGHSGMGNYHGFFGFRAFSHEKAVMKQSPFGKILRYVLYPPYRKNKLGLLKKIIKLRL